MSKAALRKRVTIRLSGPLLRRLEAAAEADSRPVASIIRKILDKHIAGTAAVRFGTGPEPQPGREITL
jgi:predicted DNA-binding protein